MDLRLVYNKAEGRVDHLALFNVGENNIKQVRSIRGHSWVKMNDGSYYNKYPINSLYSLVATFPGISMSPGMKRFWDRIK